MLGLVVALAVGLCRCEPFETTPPTDDAGGADAAVPLPDGSSTDGGPGTCVEPRAPSAPCFGTGGCVVSTTPVAATVTSVDLRNPHGLALDRGAFYFAVQEGTTEGRAANARGALFRVQDQAVQRVTELEDAPAYLVASGGYLYWRVAAQRNTNDWEVHRARLPMEPCGAACPGAIEVVARVRGAPITGIYPFSGAALFLKYGEDQLHMSRFEGSQWSTTAITIPRITPARLAKGRQAFWGQGRDLWRLGLGGPVREHVGSGIDPQMKLLHTTCSTAAIYDDGLGIGPLYEVTAGAKAIDCGGAGGCKVVAPTFDLDSDVRYFYVGRPNDAGVQAIPRSGGAAALLAAGDVWDVAVDDDYVYFTDVSASSIRRIAKR